VLRLRGVQRRECRRARHAPRQRHTVQRLCTSLDCVQATHTRPSSRLGLPTSRVTHDSAPSSRHGRRPANGMLLRPRVPRHMHQPQPALTVTRTSSSSSSQLVRSSPYARQTIALPKPDYPSDYPRAEASTLTPARSTLTKTPPTAQALRRLARHHHRMRHPPPHGHGKCSRAPSCSRRR
jgi:hypothetical protein